MAAFLLALVVGGCAKNPEQEALSALWYRFSAAVEAGDMPALEAEAPFLSAMNRETKEAAIDTISEAIRAGGRARIRLINPSAALITLSGKKPLSLPAERNAAGHWKLSDTITTRQTIDFVPAAE